MSKAQTLWLLASNASVFLAVIWQTVQVAKMRGDAPSMRPEGLLMPSDVVAQHTEAGWPSTSVPPSAARVAAPIGALTADQVLEFLANPAARDPRARAVILNWWNQENADMATINEKLADALAKLTAVEGKVDTQSDRLAKVEQIDSSQDQKIAAQAQQINELLAGQDAAIDALLGKADSVNAKVDANGAKLDALASKTV